MDHLLYTQSKQKVIVSLISFFRCFNGSVFHSMDFDEYLSTFENKCLKVSLEPLTFGEGLFG